MRRKIIKQGHSTLTITLPSEWTKRLNLSAGDEVEIIERDNGLFISRERNGDSKKAEFDISGLDIPTIWKYFMSVYREGFSEVKVRFTPGVALENPYKYFTQHALDLRYKKEPEKKPIVEVLQGYVNRFIGFEIVEHGKDYILIKEMGELTSKEFDNSLRRIFLLIQQMSEETLEALRTGDPSILEHMHDIDINIDKFQDYCIRILNRTAHKEPRKSTLLFSIIYFLELIGDEYKNIANHLINDLPHTKFKNMEEVALSIKEQIDLFYELFYKFNKEKVLIISEIDKKRYFSVNEMYKKAREEEKEIFHHFRMMARFINALIELRIEMEF